MPEASIHRKGDREGGTRHILDMGFKVNDAWKEEHDWETDDD